MTPEPVSVVFKCGHTVVMFSPGLADPCGLWQAAKEDNQTPESGTLCGPCQKKTPKISR